MGVLATDNGGTKVSKVTAAPKQPAATAPSSARRTSTSPAGPGQAQAGAKAAQAAKTPTTTKTAPTRYAPPQLSADDEIRQQKGQKPRVDRTDAKTLDERVPVGERTRYTERQSQAAARAGKDASAARKMGDDPVAARRSSMADFYDKQGVHVGRDGKVYAASYDERTGDLRLTRRNELVTIPVERDPFAAANEQAHGLLPEQLGAAQHAKDTAEGDAPEGDRRPRTSSRPAVDMRTSTVITIADVTGTQRTTTDLTALAPTSDGIYHSAQRSAVHEADGSLVSSEQRTHAMQAKDGHVVTATTISGRKHDSTYEEVQLSGTKDALRGEQSVRVERSADGTPVRVAERYDQTTQGVRLLETRSTSMQGGMPVKTNVDRTASTGDLSGTQHIEATWDTAYGRQHGRFDYADVNAGEGQGDFDLVVAIAGGLKGERAQFGNVVGEEVEDGEVVTPAVMEAPGLAIEHRGVAIFQERGMVADSAPRRSTLTDLKASMDRLTPEVLDGLQDIRIVDHGDVGDREMSEEWGRQFTSAADVRDDHMTVYVTGPGGKVDENMFVHELGHVSGGDDGGAPVGFLWNVAVQADNERGAATKLGTTDRPVYTTDTFHPILTDGRKGITEYADEAILKEDGNENEDWAESLMLYNASRRDGALAVRVEADGSRTPLRFTDLYPERAKLLEEHYGFPPERSARIPEQDLHPVNEPAQAHQETQQEKQRERDKAEAPGEQAGGSIGRPPK